MVSTDLHKRSRWAISALRVGGFALALFALGCGDKKSPLGEDLSVQPAAKRGGVVAQGSGAGGETAFTTDAGTGTWGGYNETNCPDYGISEYTLWAGKTNDAGTVSITNDDEHLYVTYNTNGTADLKEVHVYVWESEGDIPDRRPAPGQAPYTAENLYVDSYTVEIPMEWGASPCGETLYISTHAALVADGMDGDDEDDGTSESNEGETGYAGGTNTPDGFTSAKGAWWGYVTFEISCFYDISGTVYQDADNSGNLEQGEPPFSGIAVTLLDGDGNVVETTVTDEEGQYLFEYVPEGNEYSIMIEEAPADHIANENAGGIATGLLDGCREDLDFGFVPVYDLSGTLYRDADCSEDFEAGETGISEVVVVLTNSEGTVVATATTSPEGAYIFEDIMAGDYQIAVGALPDYAASENSSGFTIANLSSDIEGIDFGFCPLYDLSGIVYTDDACDSYLGGPDTGLVGVSVSLLDEQGAEVASTTTDADGAYLFEDILGGDAYRVEVETPADYTASENGGGVDTGILSGDLTNLNFGFCPPNIDPCEIDPTAEGCGDGGEDFPTWGQAISHIVLVFTVDSCPSCSIPDNDGYYTVKVDEWNDLGDQDLDGEIAEILLALENEGVLNPGAYDLLGSSIKGGRQVTAFYAYGSHNTNGEAADGPPPGIGITYDGTSSNEGNQDTIDVVIDRSVLGLD